MRVQKLFSDFKLGEMAPGSCIVQLLPKRDEERPYAVRISAPGSCAGVPCCMIASAAWARLRVQIKVDSSELASQLQRAIQTAAQASRS